MVEVDEAHMRCCGVPGTIEARLYYGVRKIVYREHSSDGVRGAEFRAHVVVEWWLYLT